MSWHNDIYYERLVNTSSAKALKEQFDRYHDWCWYHGFGNCDICGHWFNMMYLPIRIEERRKEIGLV